ncbi:MAG: hypothetical protein ACP5NQ_07690 [Vulcanisaeta sp.]
MGKDLNVKIEDVIKVLLYSDSHWVDYLRRIDFGERMKLVQDAVNEALPDFVDCINKSLDSDVPRLMYIGCFDMIWQSMENRVKAFIGD